MVVACIARSAPVVGYVCDGRLGVEEVEVGWLEIEHVVGVEEDKVVVFLAFEVDSVLSWGTEVSQGVVVSFESFRQVIVLVQMVQGVHIHIHAGTRVLVHCPCLHIDRCYLFLLVIVNRVRLKDHVLVGVRLQVADDALSVTQRNA